MTHDDYLSDRDREFADQAADDAIADAKVEQYEFETAMFTHIEGRGTPCEDKNCQYCATWADHLREMDVEAMDSRDHSFVSAITDNDLTFEPSRKRVRR